MIVIAIISILSSVAIPAYQGYIQKAALTDILQTLSPYRSAVELCRYENEPRYCNSDSTFMPPQFRSRYLSEIAVLNGVINATGKAQLEGLSIVMSLEKTRMIIFLYGKHNARQIILSYKNNVLKYSNHINTLSILGSIHIECSLL